MDYRIELALWTAGSIVLSVIGASLAWHARQQPQGRTARSLTRLASNPFGRALLFVLRFAYYIGLPYVTLLRHTLSPVSIGLVGTQTPELPAWMLGWSLADWSGAAGWTIGLGGLAGIALALGWWNAHRALGSELPSGGLLPAPSLFVTAQESVYAEIHWAFYRGAPLLFIPDLYWATLVGAALQIVEWALDPFWRAGLANGSRREVLLIQTSWLTLSTAIFALAHNVWPILALHIILAWACGRWVTLLSTRAGTAPAVELSTPELRKARRL